MKTGIAALLLLLCTVTARAGDRFEVEFDDTLDSHEVEVRDRGNGRYRVENRDTGVEYDVKDRGNGRYDAWDWQNGRDYEIRMKDNGRGEVYDWQTGEYTDIRVRKR